MIHRCSYQTDGIAPPIFMPLFGGITNCRNFPCNYPTRGRIPPSIAAMFLQGQVGAADL